MSAREALKTWAAVSALCLFVLVLFGGSIVLAASINGGSLPMWAAWAVAGLNAAVWGALAIATDI